MLGVEELSKEDQQVVTGPASSNDSSPSHSSVTEQFTDTIGRLVDLDDALDGCERILADEFADRERR